MWGGIWCGGTIDGWGCSEPLQSGLEPRVPDEEESELIAMLSFLALGHRWPWGVPAQDREN